MDSREQNVSSLQFDTIEALRAFHRERFIQLAYRTLLGRDADADGLAHWMVHLGTNISPELFLAELRRESGRHTLGALKPQDTGQPRAAALRVDLGQWPDAQVLPQLSALLQNTQEAQILATNP